ncbi:MAG: hypothetical protein BWZ03_00143 [bacterium ADurb.BinA186]|nr:MAG: hypothetical protein BWZ03_00143 [bacterium ADurb.BinA186]
MNIKEFKKEFEYRNGFFYRKFPNSTGRYPAGYKIKGALNSRGYLELAVKGRKYLYHRVVFMYFNGRFPKYTDHINRIKIDNRIENLRECTGTQNQFNKAGFGSSGYRGVYGGGKAKTWAVRFKYKGEKFYYGNFKTKEDAAKEYNELAKKLVGDFAFINTIKPG